MATDATSSITAALAQVRPQHNWAAWAIHHGCGAKKIVNKEAVLFPILPRFLLSPLSSPPFVYSSSFSITPSLPFPNLTLYFLAYLSPGKHPSPLLFSCQSP